MKLKIDKVSLLSLDDWYDKYTGDIRLCAATDFALIRGAYIKNGITPYYTKKFYWVGIVDVIDYVNDTVPLASRDIGIRPILEVSNLNDVSFENANMVNDMLTLNNIDRL